MNYELHFTLYIMLTHFNLANFAINVIDVLNCNNKTQLLVLKNEKKNTKIENELNSTHRHLGKSSQKIKIHMLLLKLKAT